MIATRAEGASKAAHGGDQLVMSNVWGKDTQVMELEIVGARHLRLLLRDRGAGRGEHGSKNGKGAERLRH